MKKNILLINPAADNEALWVTGDEGPEVKNNILPLGLATIAGLTPEAFRVDIWDELVHGLIDDTTKFEVSYDLVGITGYKAHLPRNRHLAQIFRKHSIPVAVGGPGVSATPAEYEMDFDILFIGEAEKTWPQFLRDWQQGEYKSEYRQIEKIDLTDSPLPKWNNIAADVAKYAMGSVQTTRGCPFDCEFCDVIYLFGRRPRHKPIENILEEVRTLERLGVRSIFFCDDEFIGDRQYAKDLLRALVPLNNSFSVPLTFSTQLTMNVSRDEELLRLLADANFYMLFIGIETPNKESLRESNKMHNIRHDLVEDVHKILSYGMAIRAGIIVGFDNDDKNIFDIQYDFIQKSFLPSVAINMLKVPMGTKLWARMRAEGRVEIVPQDLRGKLGHPRSYTTIIPKQMSRVDLMKGYRRLLERVFSWESFAERILGFISVVAFPPQHLQSSVHGDDGLEGLDEKLKVGSEGSAAIKKINQHMKQRAPYLMARVKALVVQQARYYETINKLLPQVDRQIELESSGKLTFEPDNRPIIISPAFKEAYKEIFPDIYQRISMNLVEKEHVNPALVEVFVDFLVTFGKDFKSFETYHRLLLEDICDRSCAKHNGQRPDEFTSAVQGDVHLKDIKRLRLDEDVLKSVEQILVKLASAGTAGERLIGMGRS